MCRYIFTLAVFVISFPVCAFADHYFLSRFDADGRYYSVISDKRLKKTPKWDCSTEDPPFDIQSAVIVANKAKKKLVMDSQYFEWRMSSIKLHQVTMDHWYWLIEYNEDPREGIGLEGVSGLLRIGVLMDGGVIVPHARVP